MPTDPPVAKYKLTLTIEGNSHEEIMRDRQKGKHLKRPRSWHHRFNGPDRAFSAAIRRLDEALNTWTNRNGKDPQ